MDVFPGGIRKQSELIIARHKICLELEIYKTAESHINATSLPE
jgi:hypothetical protein